MNKTQLKKLDRKLIWHPFTQMQDYEQTEPLVITSGKGSYLFDIDGKKYLDGVSSLWVTVHGHRHPKLDRALKKQVGKIAHSTLLGLGNVPSIELAQKLLKIVPQNLKKVFYSDSGSTAMEIALKMAYQYWQLSPKSSDRRKKKFLTFKEAYHGDTIGSVSLGAIDVFHRIFKDLLFKTIQVSGFDLKKTEVLLKKNHKHIAAIVIEPMIQGAAGMLLQPKGFLKGLEKLVRKYNVLLICDEVATGFGRTGKMFAVEHEKVRPDIMAVAKGITGGYLPLAATLTTQKIYNRFKGPYKDFKTFFHGHTYTGNPLAAAVAVENISIFEKDNIIKKLQPKIEYLTQRLTEISDYAKIKEVRQLGFMAGIEIKNYAPEERIGHQVIIEARKQGVILRPLGSVIVLMPPLSITMSELKKLIDVTFKAIRTVTNK
jgi:adenosylmethionine-8-amino-7-oxononanoate aminotransferase